MMSRHPLAWVKGENSVEGLDRDLFRVIFSMRFCKEKIPGVEWEWLGDILGASSQVGLLKLPAVLARTQHQTVTVPSTTSRSRKRTCSLKMQFKRVKYK